MSLATLSDNRVDQLNTLASRANETVIPFKRQAAMSFKNKTCLVYDYGQFVEIAATLAKSFGQVFYVRPWQDDFPVSDKRMIGTGIEGVTRLDEIWDEFDAVDLFVFPDVYESGLQKHIASLGKRVFGCRDAALLETDRGKSKEIAKKAGIDVGPYETVKGVDALREFLKKNKDQFVKLSATRGDMESWHAKDYPSSEQALNRLAAKLGVKAQDMEFIVEEPIDPAIEVGFDGYTIDGKFANNALIGIEVKDRSYLGKVVTTNAMPDSIRNINVKLAPVLKSFKCRSLMSTEIRATPDGKAYLIDPCMRAGSPPSELYQNMIGNLAEIMWEGSDGILVEPEYEAKYGAQLILTSEVAQDNWLPISFPKEYRDNVKIRNLAIKDGHHYYVPNQSRCSAIGAVVAMADSAKEAINKCREIAEEVEGEGIDVDSASLDKAHDDLKQLLKTSDKPLSPTERKAEALHAAGKISDKQLAKMKERA